MPSTVQNGIFTLKNRSQPGRGSFFRVKTSSFFAQPTLGDEISDEIEQHREFFPKNLESDEKMKGFIHLFISFNVNGELFVLFSTQKLMANVLRQKKL